MEKLSKTSPELESMNIEQLKELFPSVVTEGKIDFDKLRLLLGDEIDESNEKYQFTWHGKSNSIRNAQAPSRGTLIPNPKSSKHFDETGNLYIEGDNLEVLKLLQKTYYKKIKLIYIDPPYNTGNDFVYKDNFKDSIQNYKNQTSQTTRSNPETSGRYHTDWLNMMYPRLVLAKNLLSEDGIIFISIDDNEQSNLKKMCDEIFGEQNYICEFIWQKNFAPKNDNKYVSTSHESILLYARNKTFFSRNLLPRSEKNNQSYSNPDDDKRGLWTSGTCLATTFSEKGVFPVKSSNGDVHYPPKGRCWRYSEKKFIELIDDNRIWFGKDGGGVPRVKRFLSEMPDGIVPQTFLKYEFVGSGQDGTKELKALFNQMQLFDFPKPVSLLLHFIQISSGNDSMVLDFFSGSATTAHAVMKLNAEDGGNRKFIMVQLPEPTDPDSEAYKAGYKNICEIGKERIRRAGEKVKQELIESVNKGESEVDPNQLDIGFKVFKLESTNIKEWDGSLKLTEDLLSMQEEVIKEGRTEQDVLYEVLLKYGVFNQPIETININNKRMYYLIQKKLLVCLADDITMDDITEIGKRKPHSVIFKESGFKDDNVKMNALYTLERLGVEDIKSL
jgi:adenine-specific DNA-methyltransferase